MSIEHATFVVERSYALPVARVFAAWADPKPKARWFCEPGGHNELDFRVGGREVNRDGTPGGPGYMRLPADGLGHRYRHGKLAPLAFTRS